MSDNNKIKQIIKKHYSKIAGGDGCCSCSCGDQDENEQIAKSIGYSDEEIKSAGVANLGLGCGNPTGMGDIKKGGRMYVSDIVLFDNLTKEQKENERLIAGCVGGALLKDDYLKIIKDTGFEMRILSEDKDISKRQYQGIALESLKVEAKK
ncbi:MAG: hypothetical protein PHI45_02635 [Candidatus Pacebacteria bacterium]|nr:hypothetical protein [Candidatus Paceibacterota bacterium]